MAKRTESVDGYRFWEVRPIDEDPIGKEFASDSGGATATLLSADGPPTHYELQLVEAPKKQELTATVVIPFYNRDEMVFECLESVVLTCPTFLNCEIVVVDDGSDDPTILQRLMDEYPVTGLRLPENEGVAVARNRGNAVATGDVIIDLDSDDIAIDGGIGMAVEAIDEGADYVYGDILKRGEEDVEVERPDWRPNILLSRGCFVTGLKAYRRVLWEKIGGFDESLRSAVDLDFAIRAEEVGAVFSRVPQPLAVYREHKGQMSHESFEAQNENARRVIADARNRRGEV